MGCSWDEPLPDDLQWKWMKNVQVLNDLLKYETNRKLKPDDDGMALAMQGRKHTVRSSSYTGNSKITATPLSRSCTIIEALKFANIEACKKVFWIDSRTVLSWIRNSPRKFKPFVSARVAEIQETVDVDKFRYIPSNLNPADALTREYEEIPSNEHQNLECGNDHDILKEMKGMTPKNSLRKEEQHPKSCCVAAALDFKPRNPTLESLLTTCSSFIKVRKVLAYVLRFVHNLRQKSKETGAISVEELRRSETFLYKWAQENLNREDVGKSLTARKDDQGIPRAHGRLEKIRTLPAEMRNPIILPHNHRIVLLLLKHLHEKRAHCGYKSLTYESRKKFWIIGVRSIAKQLTRN
ncbi:uncharacterized protein [Montipora foliosa]|uniref:uncharacterized protein n=1 Tax=Montipora foliosa TaxID=591990 RepID=UPI0035F1CBD4